MDEANCVIAQPDDGLAHGDPSKLILAVLVLYKVAAEASPAFTSLRYHLTENEAAAAVIELVVFDNSPKRQLRPDGYTGLYVEDTSNPGLARCYNAALSIAEQRNIPWLMLLDQDTTLTAEYLHEVVEETCRLREGPTAEEDHVVALAPKLLEGDQVHSPNGRPTFQHTPLNLAVHGVSPIVLQPFNSGSVIRVEALRGIGGFPEDFWLDFLDQATFHQLQAQGGRIFVLHSCLAHELSSNARVKKAPISRERFQSVLDAERTFYRRYGTAADRAYARIRLLRIFARTLLLSRRPRQALQALRAAFEL